MSPGHALAVKSECADGDELRRVRYEFCWWCWWSGRTVEWAAIEAFLPPSVGRLRRSALASSFLAALELARQGRVELAQSAPFAPLYLRAPA